MLRTRFERVSLRYGCHDGEWTLPSVDRPIVIAGPNGSGKTTLIEGMIRTLFGFDRRKAEEAAALYARRPWELEGLRGSVLLTRNGDRVEVRRDFETATVRVLAAEDGVEHFHGDGNPAARNQEARHYRQILRDLLGLSKLASYRQTLLVEQGELLETELGEHLLRIAAGGHARVEAARRQIAHAHRAVTRRPLHPGAAAAINPRDLEKAEEELAAVRARLEAAREAGERRGPLALDRERTARKLEALDDELRTLEEASSAIARTEAADLSARRLREAADRLERSAHAVRSAMAERDDARSALDAAVRDGVYPDDFPERLGRAEARWEDLETFGRTPAPAVAATAALLLVVAVVLGALGRLGIAAVVAAAGGVAGAAWVALWFGARRQRRTARDEAERALEGVPGGTELDLTTRADALRRYQDQGEARSRVAAARTDLARSLRAARALLRELGEGGADDDPDDTDGAGAAPSGTPPEDGGRRVLHRLDAGKRKVQKRLTGLREELDRIGDLTLTLPTDVAPTDAAVRAALAERRAERQRVQDALRDADHELMDRGTATESEEALERLVGSLEPRVAALARKADVLEAAHALITDAYDAFRDRDQDRLARRISAHVVELGAGRLDALEVDATLDEATVRTRGHRVAMTSPPLSFGELHALQLGVRLGAADFLAGVGILPPLVIDEPFVHLDADRVDGLWRVLHDVARRRQVIITTQDERLLDALGADPDIRLEPDGAPD